MPQCKFKQTGAWSNPSSAIADPSCTLLFWLLSGNAGQRDLPAIQWHYAVAVVTSLTFTMMLMFKVSGAVFLAQGAFEGISCRPAVVAEVLLAAFAVFIHVPVAAAGV